MYSCGCPITYVLQPQRKASCVNYSDVVHMKFAQRRYSVIIQSDLCSKCRHVNDIKHDGEYVRCAYQYDSLDM